MADLKNNPLLWASIIVGAGYWVVAPLATNPLLSIIMAIAVMISASIALFEYAPEAWRVVVKKKRSDDERGRGSHLAIYGFFLFAFGSVFSGTYALTWSWYGQPIDWIGSPSANFGRFCHAVGFAMMQAGPAMKKEGFEVRRSWWITAIGAIILVLLGFYLGMQVKTFEMTESMRAFKTYTFGRPMCPPGAVIGSRNKIYHADDSPYREMTIPRECFPDETDAKRAGYRSIQQ